MGLAALSAMVLALTVAPLSAQRLPPHRFFGAVTLNGSPAPAGTTIEGRIESKSCGTSQVSTAGRYVLDVEHATSTPGCGTGGATITFLVNGTAATQTARFRDGGFEQLDLTAGGGTPAPSGGFKLATLSLGDPRPCVPPAGQRQCDATRTALWNGEEAAWRERGVTNPDARFNETVVFRVQGGDPAVISIIAKFLSAPYLQITAVRFVGDNPGQSDEYVEVTNLGGGSQDMTGWSVRSPLRNQRVGFPDGFVMAPDQRCRIYTATPQANSCGNVAFTGSDVWPDDAGRAVLYYDALDLPGADTQYSADRNNQPPAPNLQGVNP